MPTFSATTSDSTVILQSPLVAVEAEQYVEMTNALTVHKGYNSSKTRSAADQRPKKRFVAQYHSTLGCRLLILNMWHNLFQDQVNCEFPLLGWLQLTGGSDASDPRERRSRNVNRYLFKLKLHIHYSSTWDHWKHLPRNMRAFLPSFLPEIWLAGVYTIIIVRFTL